MRGIAFLVSAFAAVALFFSSSFAAGDVAKGRALFNDPKFAGGVKPCIQCHPGGSGLEKAADKKEFHIAGQRQKSLEEAIDACIFNANMGRQIGVNSEQMKNPVAYIKSLKKSK